MGWCMPGRVLAVSGGRADWGLLAPVLTELRARAFAELKLVVTGQHLMPGAGSLEAIERDGFQELERVDMDILSDTPCGVTQAMGRGVLGFAELFERLRPDLLLVLGDRYEIHAAVTCALIARIPVAHLCGGDVTEGAIDDALRHGITKMSHLHFVTTEVAARRVQQLGEEASRVFVVGSPGLDRIRQTELLSRSELFDSVGLAEQARSLVVSFHPVTLEADSLDQCRALLRALDSRTDTAILLSGSNADPGGQHIDQLFAEFAAERDHAVFVRNMGSQRYLSALAHMDAMVGNSSSGLYEAPSLRCPTVNIGDRQKGRLRATSVIDVEPRAEAIDAAINEALKLDCSAVDNPYGDGFAAQKIVDTLESVRDFAALLRKPFVDLSVPGGAV